MDSNEQTIRQQQRDDSVDHQESTNRADVEEVPEDGDVKIVFELVANIYNNLDLHTLLHKILKNIAKLTNADRASLFLVHGEPNDPARCLVSELFDVGQDSTRVIVKKEHVNIQWNTGLVGFVAETGKSVNIPDCYQDDRFNDKIDQLTGYKTKQMLSAPIKDGNGDIVGVAQVINKRNGNPFTEKDEIEFKRYLLLCGICLKNAQLYEQCQMENQRYKMENERNQMQLGLATMVLEEQCTTKEVVDRIMSRTLSLIACERCQVLLIEKVNEELESSFQMPISGQHLTKSIEHTQEPIRFSTVFDLESTSSNVPAINETPTDGSMSSSATTTTTRTSKIIGQKPSRAFPINIGITGHVASTGETLNIVDVYKDRRFDVSVDEGSDFKHRSILCTPIRNNQPKIIGVIQLINKKDGKPFSENDKELFQAFAIFCGLGIHKTLMYEQVLKVMAKQRVTLDILSYHARAPLEQAEILSQELAQISLPTNLTSFKFDDSCLNEQQMAKSCLYFFHELNLIRRFKIDQLVFCNWILTVQKNYRTTDSYPRVGGSESKECSIFYHNWRHAFNTCQMMFAILRNTQMDQNLSNLETLALLIACLCHDLDHRGTNNSFQIKFGSPLAQLYSTSTMEHHHFDQCMMILNSKGNQILSNLSPEEYSQVIVLIKEAILATDLAKYFEKRDTFFLLVNSDNFDWRNNEEHRSLLRCMLMTACDLGANTKPWFIHNKVVKLVMMEFYQQGDIERETLKEEPIDILNRNKISKLATMQSDFIESICAPIYTALTDIFPRQLCSLQEGCLENLDRWKMETEGGSK